MQRLVRAWRNDAWSANDALLTAVLEWLPKTTGGIVECGSGLSTLVLAAGTSHSDRTIVSLEHELAWAERVTSAVSPRLRSRVRVVTTPLCNYGEYDWYSLDKVALPSSIGLVICDGPPGSTRGGRYGFAPVMGSRLADGCIVLLDDTQRPEERLIVRRWCEDLGASVIQEANSYTVLAVRRAAATKDRLERSHASL